MVGATGNFPPSIWGGRSHRGRTTGNAQDCRKLPPRLKKKEGEKLVSHVEEVGGGQRKKSTSLAAACCPPIPHPLPLHLAEGSD